MDFIEPIEKLIAAFTKLPGVGRKTAERYAYAVINMDNKAVEEFAVALTDAKEKIHYCSVCGSYTDSDICDLCNTRDNSIICVVKDPRDVKSFEKLKEFKGVYHVLHGTINPMSGIGVNDIRVKELLARLDGVNEVIMALNPDVEGETTAMYISRLIKPLGIKVTKLAHGIPIGADIEYTDENTLGQALADRREI